MGLTLYPPDTAPEVYDIVWCKWPRREDNRAGQLGKVCLGGRCPSYDGRENRAGIRAGYGAVWNWQVEFELHEMVNNVVIERHEFRDLGLHKPTVFQMDLRNCKRLPWCVEYFVPQEYLVSQNIIAGHLNEDQQTLFHACFSARNLKFPLP